jgi:hypothetical protein
MGSATGLGTLPQLERASHAKSGNADGAMRRVAPPIK